MEERYRNEIEIKSPRDLSYVWGYDCAGRVIARSEDHPNGYDRAPFEGLSFITLEKTDALNIISMLDESITRLSSKDNELSATDVYGDRADSMERLYSYLLFD